MITRKTVTRLPSSRRPTMQQLALAMLAIHCLGSNAMAAPLNVQDDVCYSRTYSAAHLSSHPEQRVNSIRFSHTPSQYNRDEREIATRQDNPNFRAKLQLTFRDRSGNFFSDVFCFKSPNGQWCGVECDGGGFYHTTRADGSILIDFRKTGGIRIGSSCGEMDVEEETSWFDTTKSDDKLFRLDPAPLSACR